MIELKTFDKSRVNPVDDGVLYNALAGESGILTGCGLTAVGGAQVQIRDGYLILCGRVCKVSQEVIYANLSTNGVQEGQLVTVIDLSNAENPIKFEVRLPKGELIQEDINAGGTIYELEIATYTADELSVKSITTTANKIGLAKEKTLAQPNGIATLDGSGKLAQMPTAADVGAVPVSRTVNGKPLSNNISLSAADVSAIKLAWSTLINEESEIPNKYNFDDYITPGDVVSVCNYASARSIANIPETVPGKLYVFPLRTDDQGRNDLMQEYHTVTGNVWCRPRYYYSTNAWSAWSSNVTKFNTLYEGLCNTNNTTLNLAYPITNYRLLIVTGTTNQYGTHWAQGNILPVGENPGEGGRKFVVGISDRGTARLLLSGSASLTFKFVEANKILTISGFGAEATLTGVFGIK